MIKITLGLLVGTVFRAKQEGAANDARPTPVVLKKLRRVSITFLSPYPKPNDIAQGCGLSASAGAPCLIVRVTGKVSLVFQTVRFSAYLLQDRQNQLVIIKELCYDVSCGLPFFYRRSRSSAAICRCMYPSCSPILITANSGSSPS